MRRFNSRAALIALLVAIAGDAAQAQPVPDPRIDQRVRPFTRSAEERRAAEDEAILTGRDDILLMRRRRFFSLFGSASGGYSDNVALSPTMREGDAYVAADLGLRVATQLGGLVDVYAEGGLSTTRYFDQTGLDLVAAFGAVGAHVAAAGFDVDLAYTPSIVWDGDVEDRQLTQHRFSAGISRAFRVGRGLVRLSAGGERIEADPAAFQNFAANAGLSGILPLGPRGSLVASVRGVRRWYDNYFEGLLGLERRDWYLEGAVALSWQIHPNIGLETRISHARNWSTADISRYRVTTAAAVIRAVLRF